MERLSRTGQPLNRPLFWDFPEVSGRWPVCRRQLSPLLSVFCLQDPHTWNVAVVDAYMFGADYLMAPVTDMGARNKTTYLPSGASYRHFFTNETYAGGKNVTVDAPLDEFPLFRVVRHAGRGAAVAAEEEE